MRLADSHSGGSPIRTWIAGGLIAIGLHAAAVAVAFMPPSEDDPDDDAAGVTIPIEMVSVAYAAPSEVAPRLGPVQSDIAAQVANNAEPPKPLEAQKSDNRDPPPEREGEVVLPKPATQDSEDVSKTKEQKETNDKPVAQTVAPQEAAALSTVTAPPTPQARALSPGISPSQRQSRQTWQKALVTHIDKFKRYPDAARRDHVTGDTVVVFSMNRQGDVLSAEVVQGSGSSALDEEALTVLQRAKPLPLPPDDVQGETFQLRIPIRFRIK